MCSALCDQVKRIFIIPFLEPNECTAMCFYHRAINMQFLKSIVVPTKKLQEDYIG